MEACYINTAHPDFLSGHQAIAIVNEQLQAKNQPAQITDKQHGNSAAHSRQQQLAALQTNNASSASSFDSNNESNGSFFGSFFAGPKKTKKTSGALMEAVSYKFYVMIYTLYSYVFICYP